MPAAEERPLFCGKKWVSAPQEQPGLGFKQIEKDLVEITPGKSYFQQGQTATCKDPQLRLSEVVGGFRIGV